MAMAEDDASAGPAGDGVRAPNERGPLVSVLVRSLGRPSLDQALASVAAQSYPNLEVVVVDAVGAGHPAVGPRCGPYPLHLHGAGRPLSRSRAANEGLAQAGGAYLIFLDDDDWFDPGHVAGLVEALAVGTGRAAYAGVRAVDQDGATFRIFNRPYSPAALRAGNYIPLHAMLFARGLVEEGCSFDEDLEVYEDWDFFLQLARRTAFVHVDRITASYRLGGGSGVGLSADDAARRANRHRVLDKWKTLWSASEIDEALQASSEGESADAFRVRVLEAEVEGVAERLGQARQTLTEVLLSRSWKLTSPLRLLGRAARAVRLPGSPGAAEAGEEGGVSVPPNGRPAATVDEPPLVSVVMPVYQACRGDRRFLPEAFRSVCRQTYGRLELIIVDDGSTDETREVCEALLGSETRVSVRYRRKENGGQSSARNAGIALARGPFIGFIDQDDAWFASKLETVVPHLGDGVDVVYTDADTIDSDGQSQWTGIHRNHHCGAPHPKSRIEDILFKDIFVMPGVMTVRREALLRVGGFDESLSGYEDDDLFLRLWSGGRVDYLPVSTLKWRIYRDSYSQSERMVQSRLRYCRKLLANHTDGGRDLRRVRGIAHRFVTEFWCQAAFQLRDANPLYRRNFEVGAEVVSQLSAPGRVAYGGLVARWFRLAERSPLARRVLVAWLSHVYSGRR